MLLRDLVKGIKVNNNIDVFLDTDINKICIDSNRVQKNDVFICINGSKENGTKYYMKALEKGASIIVTEKNLYIENQILVDNAREVFALMSKNFFNSCCDNMKIIGITGTNGKTTTSYIIYQILKNSGKKVGIIGTLGIRFDDVEYENPWTTPDPDFLHDVFEKMYESNIEYVIMEVSAHAIEQKKIEGVKFEIGVLTNITQDHLDYFKNMENYANTKLSFFDTKYIKLGILNSDDNYSRKLINSEKLPILSYGMDNPCDVFAIDIQTQMKGSKFTCNLLDNIYDVETNLVGEYNIQNILAAMTVCSVLGVSYENVLDTLKKIKPIEGRFNVITYKGINIVIDFAHTPDSLEKLLMTAKFVTEGKLYCVFGCGGNRDKDKRAKMGKITEDICDFVCVTSDNPRYEKPLSIIFDIEKGMIKNNHTIEPLRYDAIKKMLLNCQSGDTLVIAGKGGERYQEINGIKENYNDYDAVVKCIKEIFKCEFSLENIYGC
ncbi:MAG: UDP-N-acetylmuramoyl-L-alanyl-D-glutamate--2,6-diaminopimelate ligase [Clostridia bacterium]|nr:UDP-N-acetylmuramoyl-L-alanyl-D-glutamate--2,6-diaminopimelate ligase [Clostridia bacterium]